jgi:hypothetical protein
VTTKAPLPVIYHHQGRPAANVLHSIPALLVFLKIPKGLLSNGIKASPCFRPICSGKVSAGGLTQIKYIMPPQLILPGVSSRAPCNAVYQCQLHMTGGSAPSLLFSGRLSPSCDCMYAELLPVAGIGPCYVSLTPTLPTSGSVPEASAQYLPAGNRPLTAAPLQSVSQHIKVKYASFYMSCQVFIDFIITFFFLILGSSFYVTTIQ